MLDPVTRDAVDTAGVVEVANPLGHAAWRITREMVERERGSGWSLSDWVELAIFAELIDDAAEFVPPQPPFFDAIIFRPGPVLTAPLKGLKT
jgi:hypothetical protein